MSPLETHSCGLLPAPESGGWPDVAAEGPCFSGESAYSLIIFNVLYIRFKQQNKMCMCMCELRA